MPYLHTRVTELVENLDTRCGTRIDLAEWISLFALDFMGDFVYSGAFSLMKEGADTQGRRKGGESALRLAEIMGTVPWVRPLLLALPGTKTKSHNKNSFAVAEKRRAKGASARDLWYYLVRFPPPSCVGATAHARSITQLDEDGESGHSPLEDSTLTLESGLAIVAGSDTTSTTLANALFYLLHTPGAYSKLRAELDAAAFGAALDVELDSKTLADLPLLNGVM
jgi:hypothetical protein